MFEVAASVTPRAEQAREQIAQQHRVRDVGNRELVEADDARVVRDFFRDELERILDVAVRFQAARARSP